MPSTASAGSPPSAAGSASTAAYPLMARRSALPRLVDVGLLRHVRLGVVGLGGGVDLPVPEQRAAAPLLVLEGRPLGLQLVDEGGDLGGVGLPEQGHGEAGGGATAKNESLPGWSPSAPRRRSPSASSPASPPVSAGWRCRSA